MAEKICLNPEAGWDISTLALAGETILLGHHGCFMDRKGNPLESVEEQAEGTLRAMERSLAAVGAGLADLVKVTVILRDIEDFEGAHAAWKRVLAAPYPARTTLTSAFADPRCRIQMEGVAALPSPRESPGPRGQDAGAEAALS